MTIAEHIARLRKLEAEATPSPWHRFYGGEPLEIGTPTFHLASVRRNPSPDVYDTELIVSTRNALPGLLDALEVAAEALGTIRVHLMCEVLPGAHRTEMPLTEINGALAKIEAALNKEKS